MTKLRIWFAAAVVLSFGAGAAATLVATRMLDAPVKPRPPGDADAYVERFEREIGPLGDAQRRALHSHYDQYWRDLQALSADLASQHREELDRIDAAFRERVYQILDPDQRRRWSERSRRATSEAGARDSDDSGEDPERPDGDEK